MGSAQCSWTMSISMIYTGACKFVVNALDFLDCSLFNKQTCNHSLELLQQYYYCVITKLHKNCNYCKIINKMLSIRAFWGQ